MSSKTVEPQDNQDIQADAQPQDAQLQDIQPQDAQLQDIQPQIDQWLDESFSDPLIDVSNYVPNGRRLHILESNVPFLNPQQTKDYETPLHLWRLPQSDNVQDRRENLYNQFTSLSSLIRWSEDDHASSPPPTQQPLFACSPEINSKISLFRGSLVYLETDAILNAANESCLGGGGIDGAIHNAASDMLLLDCCKLGGCSTGHTKITKGYDLPARFVMHTVGPIGEDKVALERCYKSSLALMRKHKLRSLALSCVSTGIYGYPLRNATTVALKAVREWLEVKENRDSVDVIVFGLFLQKEMDEYRRQMDVYFPRT